MENHIKNGLFIFHRDLRITDNVGFTEACFQCDTLYVAFIFDPRQVVQKNNKYRSKHAIHFMFESLADLYDEIHDKYNCKMSFLFGDYENILRDLIETLSLNAIFENRDYTPFAKKREDETRLICKNRGVQYNCISCDYYLLEPGTVLTGGTNGAAYKKFTPFYEEFNRIISHIKIIPKSYPPRKTNVISSPHPFEKTITLEKANRMFLGKSNEYGHEPLVHGGRTNGMDKLRKAVKNQSGYGTNRDLFMYETTFLSAYLHP